jgi:uncharacterized protein (DUF608 family)
MAPPRHRFNDAYCGRALDHIAFPLGGIGAGMLCLEGTGALSHVSLRHRPEVFHQPLMFSALWVRGGATARLLEGPVPTWKLCGPPGTANGGHDTAYGLPHCRTAEFRARFPFATVSLSDPGLPVAAAVTGWSPFTPGCSADSSLPVACLEITLRNLSNRVAVDGVYSFHARNFMAAGQDSGACIRCHASGFDLVQPPLADAAWQAGVFRALVSGAKARVDAGWFRGGWFDALTMLWRKVQSGGADACAPHAEGAASPGASLYVPFHLDPAGETLITLHLLWHVPLSSLRLGDDACACAAPQETYVPWYAGRFPDIEALSRYWLAEHPRLRREAELFRDTFFDTTLPPEVVEAVAANLSILKSPTCLRQQDGRFWAWEGCSDGNGCCHGSCTHVWNYAQALPHLFPDLERSLRETEFGPCQDERGHQKFRASLPIRPTDHVFHAASDGQLGGIMKVYREWRLGAGNDWLEALWPRVRASLDYCITTWDPDRRGLLSEPHHNTYDIEFWGPDPMCSSFYLGALHAAVAMGEALGADVEEYRRLAAASRAAIEAELFNGEYFVQRIQCTGLRAPDPAAAPSLSGAYSPEALALLRREGPKYQYGDGCLSDGVLGLWLAAMCGLGPDLLDPVKVAAHLRAVHRYNLRRDLSDHSNPQRPTYACGSEGGLLLCTWPRGNALSLPFVYSDEVWTGIEYQVASHLLLMGFVKQALEIVRLCRHRYDGSVRNPFDEVECGHWYARAMSSYGLLQGLTGTRYDAVTRTLYVDSRIPGDFRAFFATAGGFGTVGVRAGEPFFDLACGEVAVDRILYTPCLGHRR